MKSSLFVIIGLAAAPVLGLTAGSAAPPAGEAETPVQAQAEGKAPASEAQDDVGTDAEQPAPAQETAAEPRKPEKICRNIQMDMSSRGKSRVCMTAAEWKKFNEQQ